MVKIQTGYCPELGKKVSIKVTFEEIFANGNQAPQYRALGYTCEHSSLHDCRSSGEYGADCPLFKACNP